MKDQEFLRLLGDVAGLRGYGPRMVGQALSAYASELEQAKGVTDRAADKIAELDHKTEVLEKRRSEALEGHRAAVEAYEHVRDTEDVDSPIRNHLRNRVESWGNELRLILTALAVHNEELHHYRKEWYLGKRMKNDAVTRASALISTALEKLGVWRHGGDVLRPSNLPSWDSWKADHRCHRRPRPDTAQRSHEPHETSSTQRDHQRHHTAGGSRQPRGTGPVVERHR